MDALNGNDDYLLYQIAKMYYLDDMPQDAIAKAVGFSRSYISRLLDKAKERKVVTFVVANPLDRAAAELEEHLRRRFDLKFAAVAEMTEPEYQRLSFHAMNEVLASKTNEILPDFLAQSRVVALGFGSALYAISKTLQQRGLSNDVLFMPAIGTTSSSDPQTQANIIVNNIASALGARSYFTNVPIVTHAPESGSEFSVQSHDELLHNWEKVDTVIVGLGVRYHEVPASFSLNEASEQYRQLVIGEDTVGDILTRYFRSDGSEIEVEREFVRNAISFEQLRVIDRVLCVAGGADKVRGIHSAIKAGYINCLVTDMITAQELIALEEDSLG